MSFRQIMMPALLIKTHFIPIMMRDKTANEANNCLPLHRGFLLRVCAIKALLQLLLIYFWAYRKDELHHFKHGLFNY